MSISNLTAYVKKNHSESITSPFKGGRSGCIDVENSSKNLLDCCAVLKGDGINYRVVFGTLLGIYRDGELIEYDTDVDLAIRERDLGAFIKTIPKFIEAGFEVIRYDRHFILSIGRGGDYIDFYIFKGSGSLSCSSATFSEKDFTTDTTVEYKGEHLPTVDDPEDLFRKYYGGDWKTPIRGLQGSPKNASRK